MPEVTAPSEAEYRKTADMERTHEPRQRQEGKGLGVRGGR